MLWFNIQTKSKLKDENKQTHFYVCLACLADEKKQDKEIKNTFYYGCIISIAVIFYLILFQLS